MSASISFWVIVTSTATALDEPTVAGLSDCTAGGGVSLFASSALILSSKSFFGSVGGAGGRGRMRGSGGAMVAVFTGSATFGGGLGGSGGVGGVGSGVGSGGVASGLAGSGGGGGGGSGLGGSGF